MKFSKVALAAATILGGSAMLSATPAFAQGNQRAQQNQAQGQAQGQAQAQGQQRNYELSRPEQAAIGPLVAANAAAQAAGASADWASVQALIPAAQAAARSNDARYLVARIQLSVALGTNNSAGQEQAITALLANPATPAAEQATYRRALDGILNNRAQDAFNANDFATAERIYRQLLQANPNDTRLQNNLRIVQERSGNTAGALESLLQQIRTAEAGGGRASEDLYRRVFTTYYRARQRQQATQALGTLIRQYPTPDNWRLGTDAVREGAGNDLQLVVDALRFARAANVVRPADYLPFATSLNQAGLPGETKAVIDAGLAAGAIQRSQVAQILPVVERRIAEDRTGLTAQIAQARSAAGGRQARIVADALYGYGRYQEAADLYRVALSKGGEDANLINTRLGASLALAGQRAAAEAALRTVSGPRAELAQLWLAWLARGAS